MTSHISFLLPANLSSYFGLTYFLPEGRHQKIQRQRNRPESTITTSIPTINEETKKVSCAEFGLLTFEIHARQTLDGGTYLSYGPRLPNHIFLMDRDCLIISGSTDISHERMASSICYLIARVSIGRNDHHLMCLSIQFAFHSRYEILEATKRQQNSELIDKLLQDISIRSKH